MPVPTEQEVEILLNVRNDNDFFVIGKKTQKGHAGSKQQAHCWLHSTSWKNVGEKRKQVGMYDAYRLNYSDFGAEGMGKTKFASYFSFYQSFTASLWKTCKQ